MKRVASMRVKLYKKLQEYYELAGVKQKPNVKAIMNLAPALVEEEIRRTEEALDDLRFFEPKRRREDRKEQIRERIREKERLREEHAHHIQDLEDRLMGRRNRRASEVLKDLEIRIARLESVNIGYIYDLASTMLSKRNVENVELKKNLSGYPTVFIHLDNGEVIKYEKHFGGVLAITKGRALDIGNVNHDLMKEQMLSDIKRLSR
tara:strand:- start:6943 stop:7560 length:618 start_codon:yes stop_codon:yes gene_type:complete